MKAHEARSLATVLLNAKRGQEEKDIAPFLNDPEVESCLAKLYEAIRCDISQNPNQMYATFPKVFVAEALKQKALYKCLKDDGYDIAFQSPTTMTITWAAKPWSGAEESSAPERPRVSPESKVTLTTHNPFATAEVEKRIFAANVSEDGKVLSVDPVESSHNVTVE